MSLPIYLQDYKVESEQGNVNYSVIGALPNEMPNVETKQFTWNFVSHMVLEKCTRLIRIKYDFKDTEFQKEITFEDKLMGTVQLGSKVYNAKNIMKYKYDKELLEMELTILFDPEEKICGKDLSWNIFINDSTWGFPTCTFSNPSIEFPAKIPYNSGTDIQAYQYSFNYTIGKPPIDLLCNPPVDDTVYAIIQLTININEDNNTYNFTVINIPTSLDIDGESYPVYLLPIKVNPPPNTSCPTGNHYWVLENGSSITCGPAEQSETEVNPI